MNLKFRVNARIRYQKKKKEKKKRENRRNFANALMCLIPVVESLFCS